MRPAGPAPPGRDPGLQPERTRLAWRRTTLTFLVTVLLGARQCLHHPGRGPAAPVALAVVVVAWLGFLAAAHRRIRRMAASRPARMSPRTAALAAGCTVALAAVGAVLAR